VKSSGAPLRALAAAPFLLSGALLQPAAAHAQPASKLAVSEAVVHQYEDGPPIPASHAFLAGESVWVSARFNGYKRSEDNRLLLSWQMEVFDPQGVPLVETKTGKVDAELAPQDKEWVPKVRHDFLIPPLGDPGTYQIVISVTDELAKTMAKREARFQVKARAVEPSDTLVIRNFRFLRSENDGPPLNPPAYRAGDPVWAQFDITGYKLAENNRFHISYGIEVVRGDGKSMYSQPEAANEQEQSFYRKRYMPGTFSLQLTPDLAKTDYTVVIRVRDHVGVQEHESRHTFHVE
jgi:hypothetical protein